MVESIRLNVDNPFLIYDPGELDTAIEETANGLKLGQHCQALQHGAQLARDRLQALKELRESGKITPKENESLLAEKLTGFWGQTQTLKGVIFLATLAGIIQGW